MSAEQIKAWMEEAGCTLIKPSGSNMIATCPSHEDVHRSFSVNIDTGQFICFSESCGIQGGIYAFLVELCGYSFEKARGVAEEWTSFEGLGTEEGWDSIEFPDWGTRRKSPDEKQEVIGEKVLGLFDFCPRYLRDRGFDKSTLRRWEVGYDFETERATLPVRDESGDLVGISKRTVIHGVDPKYLHLGFKRSRLLYGEFFCPPDAEVWVGEGQLDAMALFQMGVEYPVATMSSRVGKRQIQRLKRYPRVVLAFDDDNDGRSAATRVGDSLLEAGHENVCVARRFSQYHDPAELMEKAPVKVQRKFMARVEPYDVVRVDWSLV